MKQPEGTHSFRRRPIRATPGWATSVLMQPPPSGRTIPRASHMVWLPDKSASTPDRRISRPFCAGLLPQASRPPFKSTDNSSPATPASCRWESSGTTIGCHRCSRPPILARSPSQQRSPPATRSTSRCMGVMARGILPSMPGSRRQPRRGRFRSPRRSCWRQSPDCAESLAPGDASENAGSRPRTDGNVSPTATTHAF